MSGATSADAVGEQVRDRYAAAATMVASGRGNASCCDGSCSCCGPTVLDVDDRFGSALYAAGARLSHRLPAVKEMRIVR